MPSPTVKKVVAVESSIPGGAGRSPGAASAERRLVRRLRKGSERAARSLTEEHWDAAYAAAFLMTRDRHLSEDVAQETILSAIRSIAEFDPKRPLRPWIHRIAVNRSIDYLRKTDLGMVDDVVGQESSAADVAVGVTDPEIVSALMTLDVEERAAVVLRHVFGYRANEIAELMNQPASTTRTQIHRALGRLRAELEAQEVTR